MTYILRALDQNGDEFFYTGRAGEGWVSKDRNAAFTYSLEGSASRFSFLSPTVAFHRLGPSKNWTSAWS
jgi:hypothetical protein